LSVPADPTLDSVRAAARRISHVTNRTPVRVSNQLSKIHGAPVMLKLETTQPTGSFKVRGAANAVIRQREERPITGVVTASTGNHGRAVAYIARTLGLDATVCLSNNVPRDRIDSIRAEGARVAIVEGDQTASRPPVRHPFRRPRRHQRTGNDRPRAPRADPGSRHGSRARIGWRTGGRGRLGDKVPGAASARDCRIRRPNTHDGEILCRG
jgi:hypothetical protein